MAREVPGRIAGEAAPVVTVSVLVAALPLDDVTEDGANVQVVSLGSGPQVKVTVPLYPPTGVTVIVATADWPAVMVAVAGETETVKSGAPTVIETALELLGWFSLSPA